MASFSIPEVERKKIAAAFDSGWLTSDGGVLGLAQAGGAMRICAGFPSALRNPRDPSRVVPALPDILWARIFAIAYGYDDADELNALPDEPSFRLAPGNLPGWSCFRTRPRS